MMDAPDPRHCRGMGSYDSLAARGLEELFWKNLLNAAYPEIVSGVFTDLLYPFL
jgi:hypothetical protein